MASPWFEGHGEVGTFALDELMATKLRALYQRQKARDLFDLWHVLVALDADDARIVAGLEHYMRDAVFTYPQLAQNLRAKLEDADFGADLVMERLGSRLRNAAPIDQIRDGAWRA